MGVLYSVYPLDEDMIGWLDEEDIKYPKDLHSRHPTPNELRAAASSLRGYRAEENGPHSGGTWQLFVVSEIDPENGPWILINSSEYRDADGPCTIWFEKGCPELIVRLLHAASESSGPLAVIPDTGCPPVVVWRARPVESTLAAWEHLNQ